MKNFNLAQIKLLPGLIYYRIDVCAFNMNIIRKVTVTNIFLIRLGLLPRLIEISSISAFSRPLLGFLVKFSQKYIFLINFDVADTMELRRNGSELI